ncbi:MAG: arginine--tRNA ligase [Alphaproteobacteria bacterium]|nr:arginine--tRNA ligase [Alphaproteobacteria bacterium]
MTSLLQNLSGVVGEAFTAQNLPAELGAVRVSDRPDLAQFQCNGAMAAAKIAKKNPRDIAGSLCEALSQNDIFEKVEIAGPGFINLDITDEYLRNYLQRISQDKRLGISKSGEGTIILDYGGPNPAKAMHVGHLRSTIIGDALKRILKFSGYGALGDVHLNDLGLPMGQIISEFEIRYPDWVYFDRNHTGTYPKSPPFTYAELEKIYPEASQACKNDPVRLEQAKKATVELQDRTHPGYLAIWEQFMILSRADMKRNFDSLDVNFELWRGEADIYDLIAPMADELKERGIAVESDGALVIPVDEEGDNKDMPPLMFYKSDGAVTYGTTDLATIYDRVNVYGDMLERIIYVVDKRQSLHFEQVFRSSRCAGYVQKKPDLVHIGYGTLDGPDGKPFKTRDGGVMRLDQLVSMSIDKAHKRIEEAHFIQNFDEREREEIARKVSIAAIKFSDLSNQPHMNYIFDLDQMTSFEGKTGPYLLYQAVRIKSLLAKAKDQGIDTNGEITALEGVDRPLALLLTEFPEMFDLALSNYSPHYLCEYAHKLAQGFSSFYGNCHILSEENENLRVSRLKLCDMVYRHLEVILDFLGITIPKRM